MVCLSPQGVRLAMVATQLDTERATLARLLRQRKEVEESILELGRKLLGIDRRAADVACVISKLLDQIRCETGV